MRVLLYEFVTGGGWYSHAAPAPPDSLLAEGTAMALALATDLVAIDGLQVDVMRDARYGDLAWPYCKVHAVRSAREEQDVLAALSAEVDWSIVIAPEFDGHLLDRCRRVEQAGGKLLGPSSGLVALASDKHATALHLTAAGVPAPLGVALAAGDSLPGNFNYPAVLKPRDGAGSEGVERVDAPQPRATCSVASRLETFCPGTAASVACLCGPREIVPLVACTQRLSDQRSFKYLGGEVPVRGRRAERAAQLAARAIATLPNPLGYLGVDLVLGDDPAGADDVVIEINPRLTTSYVGLRALSDVNLADALFTIAAGGQAELAWQAGSIQFEAAGRVHYQPAVGAV